MDDGSPISPGALPYPSLLASPGPKMHCVVESMGTLTGGEAWMKKLALLAVVLVAGTAMAGTPPNPPILVNGKAVTHRGTAKAAKVTTPAPTTKNAGASAADLESKLRMAASYARMAEFKAKLEDEESDVSWQTLGHGTEPDTDAYGDAYAKSYDEGETACNTWMVGRSAKVKVAAKVYCSVWKSTLVANAKADAHDEDFASTPGGAQFVRAQAELEAAAEE